MKTKRLGLELIACGILYLCSMNPANGSDWPQYRGVNHDGVSPDRIITNWPTEGPPQLWRVKNLSGYGAFASRQDRVFTLTEMPHIACLALNAVTGEEIWRTVLSSAFEAANSTPTVSGDRVFVLSGKLLLLCLDAQTGQIIWKRDLVKEYNGVYTSYGSAASPTVDGDLVFVNCGAQYGNNLLAFHKADGALAWKNSADSPGYATPIVVALSGHRQIIFRTCDEVLAVIPETGQKLWRLDFYPLIDCPYLPASVVDDMVIVSHYSVGYATKFTLTGGGYAAANGWKMDLNNGYSTPVCFNGHLYCMNGGLSCISAADGKVKWTQQKLKMKQPPNGVLNIPISSGGVVMAGGQIVLLTSDGYLALFEASTVACKQLACFKLTDGTCLNHPIVHNGRIYVRSNGEGVCVDTAERPVKLGCPKLNTDGSLRLMVNDDKGNCLESDRMAELEYLTSTNLDLPVSNWTKVSQSTTSTNGTVLIPGMEDGQQRFFIGIEKK